MKFQSRALSTLLGSLAFVILLMTGLNVRLFVSTTEQSDNSQYAMMKSIIEFNMANEENSVLSRAELVASLPRVKALFAAGNRKGLSAELELMFNVQKDRFGVDQSQFHSLPAVSFLRLNNPTDFGDDLSLFRPIITAVQKDFIPRKGLSISHSGPGIFGVVPVFDNTNKPIGTFEFGTDFGNILDRIKTAYGLDTVLFIDEQHLKNEAPNMGGDVYTEKNRVGKFIKYKSTNWELMRQLVGDKEISTPGIENMPYSRKLQDTPYGVVMVQLRNYTGDLIGMIAIAKDFSTTRSTMGKSMIWLAIYSLFSFVILASVIMMVVRGTLMRPLAALNQHFAALVDGQQAEPIKNPDSYYLELGTLAHNYERLRMQRKDVKQTGAS